jgi:DNA-directed RNA polymerase subunit N (RpoN/RPB10)
MEVKSTIQTGINEDQMIKQKCLNALGVLSACCRRTIASLGATDEKELHQLHHFEVGLCLHPSLRHPIPTLFLIGWGDPGK